MYELFMYAMTELGTLVAIAKMGVAPWLYSKGL